MKNLPSYVGKHIRENCGCLLAAPMLKCKPKLPMKLGARIHRAITDLEQIIEEDEPVENSENSSVSKNHKNEDKHVKIASVISVPNFVVNLAQLY